MAEGTSSVATGPSTVLLAGAISGGAALRPTQRGARP
jgi:hypothetical protein